MALDRKIGIFLMVIFTHQCLAAGLNSESELLFQAAEFSFKGNPEEALKTLSKAAANGIHFPEIVEPERFEQNVVASNLTTALVIFFRDGFTDQSVTFGRILKSSALTESAVETLIHIYIQSEDQRVRLIIEGLIGDGPYASHFESIKHEVTADRAEQIRHNSSVTIENAYRHLRTKHMQMEFRLIERDHRQESSRFTSFCQTILSSVRRFF